MPPPALTNVSPRRARSKTGCLCCRLRRKKCTEEKPICISCKKLGLPCSWPQSKEFAWRLNLGIEGDTPAREAIQCLSQVSSQMNKTRTRSVSAAPPNPSSPTSSPSSSGSSTSPPSEIPSLDFDVDSFINDVINLESPLSSASLTVTKPPSISSSSSVSFSLTQPSIRACQRDESHPPLLASLGGTWSTLDSVSQGVLRFYLEYTADRMMSQKPGANNVWKSTVLQLAESDRLVMNAVLAVGSVHLAAGVTGNQLQGIEQATTKYVLRSITGLQLALQHWVGNESTVSDDALRVMLVTCLLAEHECLGGNFNGTLQLHLRASYPVARVLKSKHTDSQMELVAHLLEHTAYLQFLSGLHFPRPGDRSGNDSIELVKLIHEGRFTLLKSYETFGAYFGCAADLYEMIPALHKFYSTRELEISTGRDLGCAAEFTRLLRSISSWEPPQEPCEMHYKHTETWFNALGGFEGPEERAAREEVETARKTDESPMVASAYAIQNSLLLFLYSAYLRHKEDHDRLVVATQPIVDESLDMIDRVTGTTWENTTWWPTVIIGSYAQSPKQKQRLLANLGKFSPPMGIVSRGIELLKGIWDAPDDVFGLDGISKIVGESEAYCFG
ncbi:fungal-specific transcription factor domain-containing protein [Fusarium solani]|uniref:Fungal-specific transcription factor domain-containing protein n=1 Tax=Fusarium solani TaxID=169388 RepID=A0A9P9FZJ5_FUSSL|nr:fungal-specific transcription factor domain-containing protein [Fusarium solani]KAH7230374.1 fungal-specific transcription factor domain-containing protein [Fusarium solani]